MHTLYVDIHTTCRNTHTVQILMCTGPANWRPKEKLRLIGTLCTHALPHACCHGPQPLSHTCTSAQTYRLACLDPSTDISAYAQSSVPPDEPLPGAEMNAWTGKGGRAHGTHTGAGPAAGTAGGFISARFLPSPHRWLCLEGGRQRRRLLGLVGTGSPESTIDFTLIRMGSSDREPGSLRVVLSAGGPQPSVERGQRLLQTRGC